MFMSHIVFLCSVRRLLDRANDVPSSPILVTLMMETLSSSETSVLTRATRRNIPEDDILHIHRREHLKSYRALTGWTLSWRRNVSPVKYELGFYIPEDDILHSHCRENLKSYISQIVLKCNVTICPQFPLLPLDVPNWRSESSCETRKSPTPLPPDLQWGWTLDRVSCRVSICNF
jgi:hypothetical protein